MNKPNIVFAFADDWGRYASAYADYEGMTSVNHLIDTPHFDQVARDTSVPVSQAMAEVIIGLDAGPDVLYHLGKHRDQAARIAQLSPVQAAVEIGRIEAGLARPKPITSTNAPEPIKPVRGSGAPQKDPAKMSMAEYKKARAAGKI